MTKSPKRSELISPFTRQRPALRASALVAEAEGILESFSDEKAQAILVEAEKFFNHEGANRSGPSVTLRKHCKLIRKMLKERPREEARAEARATEPPEQDALPLSLPVHESTPDALITPDSFKSSSDRLSQNEPKFRPAVISREESTRQRAQSMITAVDDLLKNAPDDETLTKQVQSCQDMIESLWGIMSKDIRKKSPARKIAKQQDAKTMSLIDTLNSAVETIQARVQKKSVSCCAACLKIRLGTHFLQDPSASLMIWLEETYPLIDEIVADFAGDEIYWRSPGVLKGTRKRFGLVNLWPIQDARSIGTPPTDPHGAEPSLDIPLLNVPDPRQVPRETWKTLDSTLQKLAISQIWLSNYLLTSDVMLPENHKELESAALARLGAVTDQLSPLMMSWRQRVVRDSESERLYLSEWSHATSVSSDRKQVYALWKDRLDEENRMLKRAKVISHSDRKSDSAIIIMSIRASLQWYWGIGTQLSATQSFAQKCLMGGLLCQMPVDLADLPEGRKQRRVMQKRIDNCRAWAAVESLSAGIAVLLAEVAAAQLEITSV